MKALRKLALLSAVCLAVTSMSAVTYAEEFDGIETGTCGENLTYTYDRNTGTVTITGSGDMDNWDGCYIDETGKFQYFLPSWSLEEADLTAISLPEGLTSIGDFAFYVKNGTMNKSTYTLTIPNTVTRIGNSAFYRNYFLNELTIPDSVTDIGDNAFESCWLQELTIPANVINIGKKAFEYNSFVNLTVRAENIGTMAFSNCSNLTNLTLADSVVTIGTSAFSHCNVLSDITIPESVTKIGMSAFFGNDYNTDITILNPECEIYDNPSTISYHFFFGKPYFFGTIHGYTNSTAHVYAEKYDYHFEPLDPETPKNPDLFVFEKEPPLPDVLAPGDFDGDGIVTATDAHFVLEAYLDHILLFDDILDSIITDAQFTAADVNGDGQITSSDAQYILRYYVQNTVAKKPTAWSEIVK